MSYIVVNDPIKNKQAPIKAWVNGVQLEAAAETQLHNMAQMPFIYKHLAVMPDVHWGMGATIGSVVATKGAIIPAAVGVDIGCGMIAQRTTLKASDLPDNLLALRTELERVIPHGRTNNGKPGDRGAWNTAPEKQQLVYKKMYNNLWSRILFRHKDLQQAADRGVHHLGTLGGGNHFVEICIDESDSVWVMLHSGSRGVGNRIGSYFIEKAKEEMQKHFISLPDQDLAYLVEGSEHYADYMFSVEWAQKFAQVNREFMMEAALGALSRAVPKPFVCDCGAVNCHHNYISHERHFGENVLVTRKGAVSAQTGQLGIIPGSMGAKSFIVEGKGNPESFCSCSHGAGRKMSRAQAKREFSVEDHIMATAGIECRKDAEVIDETPAAYKDIDAVMAAQDDLISIRHTLRQIVCVKG